MTGKAGSPATFRAPGTVRHGQVSTGGWNPYLKEALQTMFETGLPAIVFEELTGEEYHRGWDPPRALIRHGFSVKACE